MLMNKFLVTLIAGAAMSGGQLSAMQTADYRVVPLPREINMTAAAEGFKLLPTTKIAYSKGDEQQKKNAELLAEYIGGLTGLKLQITTKMPRANAIVLSADLAGENPEAYALTVTDRMIKINGATPTGTFRGVQTLRKSIGEPVAGGETLTFPAAEIADRPEFGYRGMHLDVSRHFISADSVKRYIDILALHNINKFHWHLTDDQGWRLEIKKHPKLTEVGSKRSKTVIGKNWGTFDNIPHEGFYTQEQVRDIVRYAADRQITIIPEIDLPGHMQGVLAAYPHLGCTGGPYEVWSTWGVSDEVLCVGNDATFELIDDVLTEVLDLFPSEYIHVGGDECPKVRWKDCPKCQARIESLGIKGDDKHTAEEYLQSYVINRAERFLNERGRKMIGWDEILEGGLSPNATVMSWRGEDGGREAVRQGHDAIMVPNNYLYFDYYQTEDTDGEPLAIGGCVTTEHVYSYNPRMKGLTDEEKSHVLGVQANLWTEYIPNFRHVEYMVLPRMAALSEVQWTDPESKDYTDFTTRLRRFMKLYDHEGYNYARHLFNVRGEFTPDHATGAVVVKLFSVDGSPIHYTLDGTEPTRQSALYTRPLSISSDCTFTAAAFPESGIKTRPISETFSFNKATNRSVTLLQPTHSNYTYKGPGTLVDGLRGVGNIRTGRWLGFNGNDMEAVIDLGAEQELSEMELRTFVDRDDWVFNARGVAIAVSSDGVNYTEVASKTMEPATADSPKGIETFTLTFEPVKARYAKVTALSEHNIPAWHGAAGNPGFLFVDEISLK